jgi:diacylglycerol O-acyltransferase-1
MRLGASKGLASFIVFFVSAVMHEVLVAIPFRIVPMRPWAFIGMIMQVPLTMLTKALVKQFPGSSIGNIVFWISFCILGQPMAAMLYAIDYNYGNQAQDTVTEEKPLVRIFGRSFGRSDEL